MRHYNDLLGKHNMNFELYEIESGCLHISLSKLFMLKYHQIDSFVETLNKTIKVSKISSFSLELYPEYKELVNESKNRLFLSIPIEDRGKQLLKLVERIDETMKKYHLPTYY